jgi:hypothetical protein
MALADLRGSMAAYWEAKDLKVGAASLLEESDSALLFGKVKCSIGGSW